MARGDDVGIVAGLRRGDAGAFERAYERYHARIYGFLLRSTRRADLADDLFQETWIALARSARTLREDTDLGAWLFTVARNAWRSHRRWQLLDLSRWLVLGPEIDPADERTPEAATEDARAAIRLERALADLPHDSREVLLLVGVEGMEQEQVATVLGVSYAALRKRLSRARALLAERLSRDEAPPARPATRGGTR